MRLVSFTQAQRTRIGLQNDAGIVDLSNASPDLPDSMSEFLLQGAEAMSKAAAAESAPVDFALPDVHLESPVLRPGKILAIGLNYRAHAEEVVRRYPKHPLSSPSRTRLLTGPTTPCTSQQRREC